MRSTRVIYYYYLNVVGSSDLQSRGAYSQVTSTICLFFVWLAIRGQGGYYMFKDLSDEELSDLEPDAIPAAEEGEEDGKHSAFHVSNKNINFGGLNKELTRVGFEPTTSGLTCRRSTKLSYLALCWRCPYIVISLFSQKALNHNCRVARDHTQITIQPGKRQITLRGCDFWFQISI